MHVSICVCHKNTGQVSRLKMSAGVSSEANPNHFVCINIPLACVRPSSCVCKAAFCTAQRVYIATTTQWKPFYRRRLCCYSLLFSFQWWKWTTTPRASHFQFLVDDSNWQYNIIVSDCQWIVVVMRRMFSKAEMDTKQKSLQNHWSTGHEKKIKNGENLLKLLLLHLQQKVEGVTPRNIGILKVQWILNRSLLYFSTLSESLTDYIQYFIEIERKWHASIMILHQFSVILKHIILHGHVPF